MTPKIKNVRKRDFHFLADENCGQDSHVLARLSVQAELGLTNGARLSVEELRAFKADLWMTLTQNPNEAAGLATALREGRIDGFAYEGACSCLVGTISRLGKKPLDEIEHSSDHPAEKWFMLIRQGEKPGDWGTGGYAAGLALEWIEEWLALRGDEAQA